MVESDRPRVRWYRWVVSGIVVAGVLSPALRDRDSFPLSTYPMYASARGSRFEVSTVVGYDRAGRQVRLSLETIALTDDPLLAESSVDRAIAAGRSAELCGEVAARAGRELVGFEVVTERHDVDAWADDRPSVVSHEVHARCGAAP